MNTATRAEASVDDADEPRQALDVKIAPGAADTILVSGQSIDTKRPQGIAAIYQRDVSLWHIEHDPLRIDNGTVVNSDMSRDGSRIASVVQHGDTQRSSIIVWERRQRQARKTMFELPSPIGPVDTLWTPDDKVVTTFADGTVRLMSLEATEAPSSDPASAWHEWQHRLGLTLDVDRNAIRELWPAGGTASGFVALDGPERIAAQSGN